MGLKEDYKIINCFYYQGISILYFYESVQKLRHHIRRGRPFPAIHTGVSLPPAKQQHSSVTLQYTRPKPGKGIEITVTATCQTLSPKYMPECQITNKIPSHPIHEKNEAADSIYHPTQSTPPNLYHQHLMLPIICQLSRS